MQEVAANAWEKTENAPKIGRFLGGARSGKGMLCSCFFMGVFGKKLLTFLFHYIIIIRNSLFARYIYYILVYNFFGKDEKR